MSCIHFTGIQNDKCKAGVRYENVRPLPCLGSRPQAVAAGVTKAHCDFYREPTAEERAAEEATFAKGFEQLATALLAVDQHLEGKADSGTMPCPICKTGQLSYAVSRSPRSISRRGNYFAVKCSTPGCAEGRGH